MQIAFACKGTKFLRHYQIFSLKNLIFPSPYLSIYSRYIPDTFPTHTRYIRISHEYSPNTQRMPHEYPKPPTKMIEHTSYPPPYWLFCARRRSAVYSFVPAVRTVRWLSFGYPRRSQDYWLRAEYCLYCRSFSPSANSVHGGGSPCNQLCMKHPLLLLRLCKMKIIGGVKWLLGCLIAKFIYFFVPLHDL